MKKVETDYPIQKIDGRWGEKNPKRIAVEEKRVERRKVIENLCDEYNRKNRKDKIRNDFNQLRIIYVYKVVNLILKILSERKQQKYN